MKNQNERTDKTTGNKDYTFLLVELNKKAVK